MKFGIHLPQAGPAATPAAIQAAAKQAEDLGFADVWVSDHLVVPRKRQYPPSAYIIEPLIALTWAASATRTVGLGTTVLVVPLRPPVLLAKMLASLDLMSEGRVIFGGASGWLKEEFEALGVPYETRGVRTDEALDIIRRCWNEDPIDVTAPVSGVKMVDMRAKPQPSRPIPIWIGGHSNAAFRRAVKLGDGWHGGFQPPERAAEIVARLRRDRPEESFTLSMRTRWDALEENPDEILREFVAYREAGIQHLVAEPRQRDLDSWLRCGEAFAKIFERAASC
ncbi:MAG: TIGR03619 family F420-dependent LLM class oxidoreductase [bacterium]|nr:TIGR03619 family F420-dependent LLM class oxidoreductase [bacterium]